MGIANHLGKLSKNLALLAKPIYAVMDKKAEWFWKELTQGTVLCAFDLNKKSLSFC